MKESTNTKFLGSEVDKHLKWKNHINKILPKLSSAYFFVRPVYSYSNMPTLKMIYFVYFHATVECGILWGYSIDSKEVIVQQKRIIRNMTGLSSGTSCKPSFQRVK